jgi:hypothetical protein
MNENPALEAGKEEEELYEKDDFETMMTMMIMMIPTK